MRGFLYAVGMLAITGCSSTTGPSAPDVVATAEVVVVSGVEVVRVTIHNDGDRAIFLKCGSFSVEGLTIEGWQPVRGQTCVPTAGGYELAADASESRDFVPPDPGQQYRGAVRFTVTGPDDAWVVYSEQFTL